LNDQQRFWIGLAWRVALLVFVVVLVVAYLIDYVTTQHPIH